MVAKIKKYIYILHCLINQGYWALPFFFFFLRSNLPKCSCKAIQDGSINYVLTNGN